MEKTFYQTVDLIREELSSIVGKDDVKNIKIFSIGSTIEKLKELDLKYLADISEEKQLLT